jgi:hypothetical protein
MKEKKRILLAYQEKFGEGYLDLIITKKKGKTVDNILLTRTPIRPRLDKSFIE